MKCKIDETDVHALHFSNIHGKITQFSLVKDRCSFQVIQCGRELIQCGRGLIQCKESNKSDILIGQ